MQDLEMMEKILNHPAEKALFKLLSGSTSPEKMLKSMTLSLVANLEITNGDS
jgi:hypothetical protein